MYRAVQKEAAELGAEAVIVEGSGIQWQELYGPAETAKPYKPLQ